MKTMKTLLSFALVLSSLTFAYAQTGDVTERFNQAKEAFDNSQFEKALTLLDAMEKDLGKSPRIESLRALTLRDLNRPRDAYLSVLAYFKLTEGMNLSNSAAHKSLIELRDTLRSQLETDLSAKKENLQSARNENAQRAISETDALSKPNTQTSTSVDPLAELEMWNKVKTSTNANDYYLFLMRFPAGKFAKQAKAKVNEIGDPVWDEVKKSRDAFVYRDFIAKNPNSPFVEEAKQRMNIFGSTQSEADKILAERKLNKQKVEELANEKNQNREKANQTLVEGVRENYLDVVQAALKEGADAKSLNRAIMKTAQDNAVKSNNFEMLKVLISAGANPNQAFVACYNFELTCSDDFKLLLVEAVADVNQTVYKSVDEISNAGTIINVRQNYPALFREIESNPKSSEVVKALIKAGANVNYKTVYNERTPLLEAMNGCNLGIIQALVDAGADFRHRPKASDLTLGESPYQQAKGLCKGAMLIFKAKSN